VEPSGRLKGTRDRGLGEKKGASKRKLANCTKTPVQLESAMRGQGAMRADKTECAIRGERNGGGQRRRERQWLRDREATRVEVHAKRERRRDWRQRGEMYKRTGINRERRGKGFRGRRDGDRG
jgi:hypothetical protein